MQFEHTTLGQRVLFGTGLAAEHVAAETARLGATNIMCIASEFEREFAQIALAQVQVALWHTDVVQHVPIANAVGARQAATDAHIDLIVCVGGGSTTGLAKAVALTTGIPIIAVPTTYAGSEATNVWGLTEEATKTTGADDKVLPATVIYDAALTLGLPVGLSVASGLNALAHCVDSLWAPRADPINAALAAEGVRALAQGLPLIHSDPTDITGRETALYGAYLSAVAFASAGSGLHHKICHVLGGTFNMPHAETHATVLPYVLAFNAPSAPEAASRLSAAIRAGLGASAPALDGLDAAAEAVALLNELRTRLDAPRALADYGFTTADIPEAVSRILKAAPASNPTAVTESNIAELLGAALAGTTPAVLSPALA
ncbi:maleylacetate reductase [Paeniglutamicibacter sulfureus]|uniref:Maleylacetate reductase n=1 Tax=Paeniglutamicibacter sulfureus TaxID=43666 RepID=A0ABU2BJI9_9MICC|nr:maleylacetate reductase [Paeniglutamicibacter sulfureus]MDR7358817.1 maleylacetate reductase [Paeniglutamicibacter sulfureus]